jgi:hypothetical protein
MEQSRAHSFSSDTTPQGALPGDTWHQTLEEAKSQAEWEYKIPPDAWTEVTVPDDDSPTQ